MFLLSRTRPQLELQLVARDKIFEYSCPFPLCGFHNHAYRNTTGTEFCGSPEQLSRYCDKAIDWTTQESRFHFWRVKEMYLSSTASRLGVVPTQPPIESLPGPFPRGQSGLVVQLTCGPECSNKQGCVFSYPRVSMVQQLIKHRDNSAFALPTNLCTQKIFPFGHCCENSGCSYAYERNMIC